MESKLTNKHLVITFFNILRSINEEYLNASEKSLCFTTSLNINLKFLQSLCRNTLKKLTHNVIN